MNTTAGNIAAMCDMTATYPMGTHDMPVRYITVMSHMPVRYLTVMSGPAVG